MKKEIVENGVHNYSAPEGYIPPKSKEVQEHLDWFMGLKLGFMMHWAPGLQMSAGESWPLCDGDSSWSQVDMDWADIETCKKDYWESNKTFNPVKFNAEKWAKIAKDCGFKYLLFTTKHHDGFCMFDTKTTDYKITAPDCPFHDHKDADIVAALYREFRKQGLAISTYFSKPDWHCPYYWAPEFGNAPDRNVNYNVEEHPELWEKFVQYTHEQIRELGTNYGPIDVLWLDGGWVRSNNRNQDIRLGEIVEELRSTTQPQLIVSDRTCGGEYENFITPEQTVPDDVITVPWEACKTVSDNWGFKYDDHVKSGRELVHLLLEIVCKGGNLALDIAPQPDGNLPAQSVRAIRDLGAWLKIFGDGIYGTHICAPHFEDRLRYTAKGNDKFVFYLYDEIPSIPQTLQVKVDGKVKEVTSMRGGQPLQIRQENGVLTINLSDFPMGGAFYAEGFRFTMAE